MSSKFHPGVPWEDLYADDIMSLLLTHWRMCQETLGMERSHGEEGVEGKCRKDKGYDLWSRPGPAFNSGEYPCAVCLTGVGNNSIYCNDCKPGVHKKCSRLNSSC